MSRKRSYCGWLVVWGLLVLGSASATRAEDILEFMTLVDRLGAAEERQNYDEAARLGDQAIQLVNRSTVLRGSEFEVLALARIGLLHFSQGNLTTSEQQMRRALEVAEKLPGGGQIVPLDQLTTPLLLALAKIYQGSGLFTESITVARRALVNSEKLNSGANDMTMSCLATLADGYSGLGRFAEAEHYHRKAIALGEQKRDEHMFVALFGLANDYSQQMRHEEALALTERGQRLLESSQRQNSLEGVTGLQRLASAYLAVSRPDDAERAAQRALQLAKQLGPQARALTTEIRATLANVYFARDQKEKARELYQQILREAQSERGSQRVAAELNLQLALMAHGEKRWSDAKSHVLESIRLLEKDGAATAGLAISQMLLGMIEVESSDSSQSGLTTFERAFETFARVRANAAGDPFDAASSVAAYQSLIDLVPLTQAVAGKPEKMFELLELSRARGLLGQMRQQGMSLVAGVPKADADRLMQREKAGRIRVTELAQKVSVLEATSKGTAADRLRLSELEAQLTAARASLVENHRDMYNAGRAYRLAEGSNLSAVSLTELQSYLAERKAVMLHYTINAFAGTVMVILPTGKPIVATLNLSDEQKRKLKMDSSINVSGLSVPIVESDIKTLTASNLQSVLMTAKNDGVLQWLSQPDPPAELTKKLQILADVLLPGNLKRLVQSDKLQEVIIVPDGPLSLLPFEVLVVESDPKPRYLLDVGLPITYAPSATVLWNLRQQKSNTSKSANPVLSLGDAVYQPSQSSTGNPSSVTELSARSRYGQSRSRLSALPYTGTESKWLTDVFAKEGLLNDRLEKQKATEAWLRYSVSGRQIVHLACHGLADDKLGNRFGALAMTPGPKAASDSLDDGFLTLSEIGDLDLRGCELTILSACESNYGPQQSGEGVWALSRGFLVAGSRRVVASNWRVDDEASASLVSYFAAGVAKDWSKPTGPNYAKRLLDSKKWVRQQDKWSSPYYWGGLVMVGPNQ